MTKDGIICAVLMLIFCSCSNDSNEDKISIENQIREAIFIHALNSRSSYEVHFLSVDDADPDEELLDRFKDHDLNVKAVSESEVASSESDPCPHVIDKETGLKGIIHNIGEIQWRSETEVEVSGGYLVACLGAAWGSYFLEIDNSGKWLVTEFTIFVVAIAYSHNMLNMSS